jgi:hypothetical protein
MNYELGKTWREVIAVCSEVLGQCVAGGGTESYSNRVQYWTEAENLPSASASLTNQQRNGWEYVIRKLQNLS